MQLEKCKRTWDRLQPDFELMQACRDGREEAARHALLRGASPNAKIHGKSCLRVAGEYGSGEIVQFLLRSGADPNEIVDHKGNTLINWAAAHGNFGFVVELLKCRADPLIPNRVGKTAAPAMGTMSFCSTDSYHSPVKLVTTRKRATL